MYKPAAKHRWVLRTADLARRQPAGKPDAAADRKAGLLCADAIHQHLPSGTTASAAVPDEIRNLARWLEQDIKLPA